MKASDSAYPVVPAGGEVYQPVFSPGMDLRTYLAGQALAGWMASYIDSPYSLATQPDTAFGIGQICVRAADGVIAALQSEKAALATRGQS